MAWQIMVPTPGGRRAEQIVTLACRDGSQGKGRHFQWVMTISQALRVRMGWGERFHVMVELDMDAGLARITPTTNKANGWALTKNKTALQGLLPIPFKGTHIIGATRLTHEVQDGSIILTLPVWAGGKALVEETTPREPRGRAVTMKRAAAAAVEALPQHPAILPPPKPTPISPESQAEREDLREAAVMLSRGATTVAVMEHFGWTRERVENLRRSLASIRRAA